MTAHDPLRAASLGLAVRCPCVQMQSLSQPSQVKLLALGMMSMLSVDAQPVLDSYGDILYRLIDVVVELQLKNDGEE